MTTVNGRPASSTESLATRAALGVLLAVMVCGAVLSRNLGLGTPAAPGPGLWPFTISTITGALLVVLIARPRLARAGSEQASYDRRALLRAAPALAAYPILLGVLGFVIPTAVVSLYWLRIVTRQSYLRTVLWGGSLTAAAYVVFIGLLAVPFPFGVLPIR